LTLDGKITAAGNITSSGSITGNSVTATRLNLSEQTLNSATPGYTRIVNTADRAVAANTWVSAFGGWTNTATGVMYMAIGQITFQVTAVNTAAKVTVKITKNDSTSITAAVSSSEFTIPAIASVSGVATIPISGIFYGAYNGQAAVTVDIYSTAAGSVKLAPPDNALGASTGGPVSNTTVLNNTSAGPASFVNFIRING
jgi:hypothetical protein